MKEVLITSSVLILVITALRFVFREKISRRLQYALWALVLVRLLVPLSLPASSMSVLSGTQALENHIIVQQNLDGAIVLPPVSDAAPDVNQEVPSSAMQQERTDWSKILRGVWMGCMTAMALWFLAVNLHLARKLKRSRESFAVEGYPLPVYLTDQVLSPCLFGLIRPGVYLTENATQSEESLHHVLTHELCHLHHGDHIFSLLRCVCLCIYWFDPLVWLAAILSKTDGELACDEAALHLLGEEHRLAYGKTLVDMIARRHSGGTVFCTATTMAGGSKSIRRRLKKIVSGKKSFLWAAVVTLLCVALCAGCTFTAGKAPRSPGQDPIVQDDPVLPPMPEGTFRLTHIYNNTETLVPRLSAATLWEISQNGHGETFEAKYIGDFEHVFRIRHEKPDGTAQDCYCYRSEEGQSLILAEGEVHRLEESLMLQMENAIGMHEPLYDSLKITRTVTDCNGGNVADGDALEYVITITNLTEEKLKQVEVYDPIGKHAGLSSKDGILTITGDDPRWVVELEAGETVTLRYKVKVGGIPGDYIYSYGGSVAGIPFPPLVTHITEYAY